MKRTRNELLLALWIVALVFGQIACSAGYQPNTLLSDGSRRPLDYVRSDLFKTLKIEIDTVAGLEPLSGVTDDVEAALMQVIDKTAIAFSLEDRDIPSQPDGVWTFEELQALAAATEDAIVKDGEISIHTMWVDGKYENENVLGVAWNNRQLVIFASRIEETCALPLGLGVSCALAQASIWTHELGHVIGLVNNGVPTVNAHEDAQHARHDVSDKSVMYWAFEGVDAFKLLGDSVPAWGTECETDMGAVRSTP